MASDPSVTVGGVTYRVTPEYLAAAASNATTTAEEIAGELADLRSYVNSLEASWGGVAHNRFVGLMAEYDVLARMMHDALTGIASGLHGNYVNYKQNEEQNLANLAAIETMMPGGHGPAANLR
jgi:WXG100 family type VII secretion target